MKDNYTTNSHYLMYTFLFKRLGECILFERGSEGVKPVAAISGKPGNPKLGNVKNENSSGSVP